jgi:hypothetical protein
VQPFGVLFENENSRKVNIEILFGARYTAANTAVSEAP